MHARGINVDRALGFLVYMNLLPRLAAPKLVDGKLSSGQLTTLLLRFGSGKSALSSLQDAYHQTREMLVYNATNEGVDDVASAGIVI